METIACKSEINTELFTGKWILYFIPRKVNMAPASKICLLQILGIRIVQCGTRFIITLWIKQQLAMMTKHPLIFYRRNVSLAASSKDTLDILQTRDHA